MKIQFVTASCFYIVLVQSLANAEVIPEYRELVERDQPVAWWRFDGDGEQRLANSAKSDLFGAALTGSVKLAQPGPKPPFYPGMPDSNSAVRLGGKGSIIRVADPGDDSELDFDLGNSITIEAWVDPLQDHVLGTTWPTHSIEVHGIQFTDGLVVGANSLLQGG